MGKKETSTPDNSPAMIAMAQQGAATQMHQSDNQFMLGMAQTGAQIMQSEQTFLLGSSAINAQSEIASERNDTRLEIARMNYDLKKSEQEDEHVEKMESLRVQKHQIDVEAQEGQQVDTSDFLA